MNHGRLKTNQEGTIFGRIVTRDICEDVFFAANPERGNNKAPSHLVMAKAPAGHDYVAGAAWPYTSQNGGGYQIKLQDPAFGELPVVFWATAKENGEYSVQLAVADNRQQQAA